VVVEKEARKRLTRAGPLNGGVKKTRQPEGRGEKTCNWGDRTGGTLLAEGGRGGNGQTRKMGGMSDLVPEKEEPGGGGMGGVRKKRYRGDALRLGINFEEKKGSRNGKRKNNKTGRGGKKKIIMRNSSRKKKNSSQKIKQQKKRKHYILEGVSNIDSIGVGSQGEGESKWSVS